MSDRLARLWRERVDAVSMFRSALSREYPAGSEVHVRLNRRQRRPTLMTVLRVGLDGYLVVRMKSPGTRSGFYTRHVFFGDVRRAGDKPWF